ncbi:DNA-binding MarR family transcriptional regulator [Naumannella cuiyingiana]|uniref:DNA-binding MarR family transcriptional regulator n=1 Tax=Naumannella cuiyingiana TaxID=1347891 RepID=A0A7Z0DA76_9ACTN|nr:MarR family transcriptional regulator [Naumannella cuiyingiana]NYI71548.1 DNA-binding MarR family transcriptional regulator [Naumannella cuiyingiana]
MSIDAAAGRVVDARCEDDDELATIWHDLMAKYHRVACALDRALAEHGLSGSEFDALEQLAGADGGQLRIGQLAENGHLTQSALSRLVARLERDGLVERMMCAQDRRSIFVKITAAGRARYRKARPAQRAALRAETSRCGWA